MVCPFMSYQTSNLLYPCVDSCALKVQGKCAIAVLAQAKLAENKILKENLATNQTEKA